MSQAADSLIYQNDFEKAEAGKVPADMQVLDGNFAVRGEGTNKFLELPGAPLDSFSLQFGPVETNGLTVSAMVRGVSKSRRSPTFGVGLYGLGGFKMQVTPAKNLLELLKEQIVIASAPFEWKSGEWTVVELSARPGSNGWKVQGKAWTQGTSEPSSWMVEVEHKPDAPPSGRASIFGSPFSGTPIDFDNLRLEKHQP